MGEKKEKFKRFLDRHSLCAYCGGTQRSESIDHAPPITFFLSRQRPQGLEIPSCLYCNQSHSPFDSLFAVIAFAQRDDVTEDGIAHLRSLISSAERRFPQAISQLRGRTERVYIPRNGVLVPRYVLYFDSPEIHFCVSYMLARLSVAVFYQHFGFPAPLGSRVRTAWSTNGSRLDDEHLRAILSQLPLYSSLSQGKFSVRDQFEYKYAVDEDGKNAAFAFHFHESFVGLSILEVDGDGAGFPCDYPFVLDVDGLVPDGHQFPSSLRRLPRKTDEDRSR
jgi:hypothetical protein